MRGADELVDGQLCMNIAVSDPPVVRSCEGEYFQHCFAPCSDCQYFNRSIYFEDQSCSVSEIGSAQISDEKDRFEREFRSILLDLDRIAGQKHCISWGLIIWLQ
jgi:hypothetical protein